MNQLKKTYIFTGSVLIIAAFVYILLFFAGLIDLRFLDRERSDQAVKLISAAILLWPGGIFIAAARLIQQNNRTISIKMIILGALIALILLVPLALLDFLVNRS